MTATLQPEAKSSSRRAVLAGAVGGIGALVAGAIGRVDPTRAEGETVVVGGEYLLATSTTIIADYTNNQTTFWGDSSSGTGVRGTSSSNVGVYGTSSSNVGVYGSSSSGIGVRAESASAPGLFATSSSGIGVLGYSGDSLPPVHGKTGVYGYAAQDSNARGVWGETTTGRAIQGTATSGYAGYFAGKVFTTKFHEMTEISSPAAPAASRARLFLRDNGSGKTQLCVRFNTGGVLVIKTQP